MTQTCGLKRDTTDKFYTKCEIVEQCGKFIKNHINFDDNDIIIEPSAGNGAWIYIIKELCNNYEFYDLYPENEEIIKQDYLKLDYKDFNKYNKVYLIGNPPFGRQSSMALKFINHSYKFADYVCFILPQLFESDGKGVPRKRVKGFNLIHSEKLDTHFIDPSHNKIKVNCIYQIWSKNHKSNKYRLKTINTDIIKIYSLSDGGKPSTTRNKIMFNKCDIYIPSTCFGRDNMKYYNNFDIIR